MKKHNLITPEGTRDLLFDECNRRRKTETDLMDLFRDNGYSEVITPLLEFYDVFEGYFQQENMYKLTDAKGRLMVLRPDSTIPIIRLAETRLKERARPLKLCYNQSIYLVKPKEAGRDDEIAQCGVEIADIGKEDSYESNKAVLRLAVEALEKTNIDYRFEIGNCVFFEKLARACGITDDGEVEAIRKLVEAKNYSELSAMKLPAEIAELPKLFGNDEVFERAREVLAPKIGVSMLELLETTYANLCELVNKDKITVDFGLTNKRGYYKGIIFNGYAKGYGKPILSGGRYKINNTYAVGFAVNVSATAGIRS